MSEERPPYGGNGAHKDRSDLDRLPPPAFPPGQRTTHRRTQPASDASGGVGDDGVPDDAFISPDEPIVRTGTRIASDAFISPDAPIQKRDPRAGGDDVDFGEIDPDEVMVTGIGDDPHLNAEVERAERARTPVRFDDPIVGDIVVQVGRFADALREKGEAGLKTTTDMSRFEATLRAYCVGYLAARRESGPE